MGGTTIRTEFEDGSQRVRVVDYRDLIKLFEDGIIEQPQIKDSDIDNRTQGDQFVKAIAFVQIVWFFAQTLGRATEGLPVTTLELFTVGNVGCTMVTYLAWWNKPNGVRVPIIIEGVAPSWVRSYDGLGLTALHTHRKSSLASLLIGFSFGALHLAAWHLHFASTTERILWRISSIGVTLLSATFPVNELLYNSTSKTYSFLERKRLSPSLYYLLHRTLDIAMLLFVGLYFLFRVYMFVEMFAALRDVPVDVYKTVQWSQYFPALG
jgi:hypothetical protein